MKFIIQVILTAAIAYFAEMNFPWWSAVIAAFIIGVIIPTTGWKSFWGGFWGIGLLWVGVSLYIESESLPILTERVGSLFQLPHVFFLFLITFLVGGAAGGFGALTGNSLRGIFDNRNKGYYRGKKYG